MLFLNKVYLRIAILLILGLLLTACGNSGVSTAEPLSSTVALVKRATLLPSIAGANSETVVNLMSDEELLQLFENDIKKSFKGNGSTRSKGTTLVISEDGQDVAELNEVWVEGAGEVYYLIGRGKKYAAEADCLTFAKELIISETTNSLSAQAEEEDLALMVDPYGVTHQCRGVRCSRCAFTKNWRSEITGCKCTQKWTFFGRCEHTIISSGS